MQAVRCPALNRRPEWIEAIAQMFRESANAEIGKLLRLDLSHLT
jgi:hypothetical protein